MYLAQVPRVASLKKTIDFNSKCKCLTLQKWGEK